MSVFSFPRTLLPHAGLRGLSLFGLIDIKEETIEPDISWRMKDQTFSGSYHSRHGVVASFSSRQSEQGGWLFGWDYS